MNVKEDYTAQLSCRCSELIQYHHGLLHPPRMETRSALYYYSSEILATKYLRLVAAMYFAMEVFGVS
jgi:hypothetical protein